MRHAVLIAAGCVFLCLTLNGRGERWTLVDFGHDLGSTQTPYPNWTEVLRHPTRSQFVNPDGNPAHSGITATPGLDWDTFTFFGIRGTVPIEFQPGHEIILTFYNRADYDSLPTVRISFNDPDQPNPNEPEDRWYTAYNIDININTAWAPAGELTELRYYIQDDPMLAAIDGIASTGAHFMVNVSFAENAGGEPPLVLTKIELSNDADLTAPLQPADLQATLVGLTAGASINVVRLTWSPSTDPGALATGVSRYYIYRNGELYDFVSPEMTAHLGANLFYLDLSAAPGSTNTYAVAAIDKAQYGLYPRLGRPFRHPANQSPLSEPVTVVMPPWTSDTLLNPWTDFEYAGGFRLPVIAEHWYWSYASAGLTWYPDGNPGHDPAGELSGSLYAYSQSQRGVGELSIPKPVRSANPDAWPVAKTLKPVNTNLWPRIYDGQTVPLGGGDFGVASLTYHPGGEGVGERLYYGICNFYATDPAAPSHGWFDLDLTEGQGAWHIGGTPPNNICPSLTARFSCRIPQAWANLHAGGRSLLIGNNLLSGGPEIHNGPSVYAIAPWAGGSLPENGAAIPASRLMQYSTIGTIFNQVPNWRIDRNAEGAIWIEVGEKSALVISYKRPMGDGWYGDTAGNNITFYNIPMPPTDNEGAGATRWRNEWLFYNPEDLAAVLRGDMQPWEPQPYLSYDADRFSFVTNRAEKFSGALGYSSADQMLFLIEHNGEVNPLTGENGLIHAWRVTTTNQTPPPPDPAPAVSPVRGMQAVPSTNTIHLAWINPTNATWIETVLQRHTTGYPATTADGLRIYTGTGTQTVDLAVTAGATYYYTAFGRDAATNWSATTTSARAMATVPAAPPPDDGTGSVTVVFQNGGEDNPAYDGCKDAFIASFQNPYQNVGASEELRLYRADSGNDQYRILIKFDLTGIPVSPVKEALLGLYQYACEGDPPPHTVAAYRITRAWEEGTGAAQFQSDHLGVSWEEAANGTAWATLGGDYDRTTDFGNGANGIVDAPTLNTTVGAWQAWDVTALVNAWIAGIHQNHGLILISTAGEWSEHYFRSSDHPTAATRPRLTIRYGKPAGPGLHPALELASVDDPAGIRILFVNLTPDQQYLIQTKPWLPSPSWVDTHPFTATGTFHVWSDQIPGSVTTSRYYRLIKP